MLVRIPVFVFQGLATSLLPNLTRLHVAAESGLFRRAVLRAAGGLAGCAALIVVTVSLVGPEAMQLVYGPEYVVGRLELALLGVGVGCYLATSTFSQALLALDRGRIAAAGWIVSSAIFLGVYFVAPGDPLMQVAVAFAAGTAAAVPLLGFALMRRGGMRTPVSVAVVCGSNGVGDALARTFDALPQATLRWICDDAMRASSIGYGPSTAWTRDFDELLQDEDLDAIAFASAELAGRGRALTALEGGSTSSWTACSTRPRPRPTGWSMPPRTATGGC